MVNKLNEMGHVEVSETDNYNYVDNLTWPTDAFTQSIEVW